VALVEDQQSLRVEPQSRLEVALQGKETQVGVVLATEVAVVVQEL
jgi:hypothetical protein